jgi:hypothetical protein
MVYTRSQAIEKRLRDILDLVILADRLEPNRHQPWFVCRLLLRAIIQE